jgi:predicted TIM-barrel fold metal-dependent hydrolase
VYGAAASLRVPVVITIGPLPVPGCYLKHGAPMPVDEVASDFPELTHICAHGGWPWVDEMVAIAFRHPNVYFDTSIYHFLPGQEACVRAANEIIGDKLLYASGFPFAPLAEAARYRALPFSDTVREQVMRGNAARILGLAG